MVDIIEDNLCSLIHDIALEGLRKKDDYIFEGDPVLSRLKSTGSQLWVDSGDKDKVKNIWKRELSGLTTNNTLANQVVQTGIMDEEIRKTVKKIRKGSRNITTKELVFEIGFIINCKIALRLVETFNVNVSVELHPALARDKEKSIVYGKRYYNVCPENFTIKIPLTPEGYLAVRGLKDEGIPVNFTLGFSARQNYLASYLSNPDYINIFLGRLNAVVKDNSLGDGNYVGEAVTIKTQKVLDEVKRYNPHIKTKLIAASIRNGQQVIDLAGIDVLTIPPNAVMEALKYPLNELSCIKNSKEKDYRTSIRGDYIERFNILWDVDERFKAFVDRLAKMDINSMSGDNLIEICEDNNINLFHRFSDSELIKIKRQGKIPRLGDWDESIALDDLMTQSALQSFAADQEELDNRIRAIIESN